MAVFVPTDISGLKLWLKADTAVYSDAGTTPITEGGTIQQWNDQSGGSNHAKQATANLRPTYAQQYFNNKSYVYFNGSVRLKVDNAANFDLTTPTIFVVGNSISGSGCFTAKCTTAFGDGRRRKLQLASSSGTALVYGAGADGANFNTATTMSRVRIYGARCTSATNHDTIIGNTITNSGATLDDASLNSASLELGAAFDNGAEVLTGAIAEILIYDTALSTANMLSVCEYLNLRLLTGSGNVFPSVHVSVKEGMSRSESAT